MARFLALFMVALLLLQTFSRELVVMDYQLHKKQITELFCVNKDKPELRCNGKCHLAKRLRKTSESESKAPTAGVAKVKYEVVVPFLLRVPASSGSWPELVRYPVAAANRYVFTPKHGVFHPPAFRV